MLLLAGLQLNRARLRAVRSGIAARFLSLEVSSQAFVLLLIADITVGYHSSDGWVTMVETLVARYNVNGAESVDTAIRLFVATAPVCLDVAFKLWCCACLLWALIVSCTRSLTLACCRPLPSQALSRHADHLGRDRAALTCGASRCAALLAHGTVRLALHSRCARWTLLEGHSGRSQ